MAASSSNLDDDIVVLEVRSPEACFDDSVGIERRISEIDAWELQNEELFIPPENDRIMKIRVHRNRLIEHSTYFGSLFGGGFKESSLDYLIVEWNLVTFMEILQFIYGGPLHVSFTNFVPLLEGALFFGVESLVMQCKSWCVQTLSSKKMKISGELLRQLIEIWNFVVDTGFHVFLDLYTDFLALNFGEIMHCESFTELPHALLKACISHPLLTVHSEKDLCEALLNWLENNFQCSNFSSKIGENPFDILEKDCSNITVHGVSNLLECKAIQNLFLRHNGSGIQRNFILEAVLKFPSLRTLSLDLCDACDDGFDTPHYLERFSLCTVKLARCKSERCAFDFDGFSGSAPRMKHSQTIVLEWNSREIRTTIVMERL